MPVTIRMSCEGDSPVTLDGPNSSDADGTIATYAWVQTAGTAVTLTNADTATATFTAPDVAVAGETLTFELTVTDNDGLTATDTVSITVIDMIRSGCGCRSDQNVREGDTVTLDGSDSSDADGTIASYCLDANSRHPGNALTNDNTATATFTAPDVAVGRRDPDVSIDGHR